MRRRRSSGFPSGAAWVAPAERLGLYRSFGPAVRTLKQTLWFHHHHGVIPSGGAAPLRAVPPGSPQRNDEVYQIGFANWRGAERPKKMNRKLLPKIRYCVCVAKKNRSETIAVYILKDVDFDLLIRITGSEMGGHIKIL